MNFITIVAEVEKPHLVKFDGEKVSIFEGALLIKFATDQDGNMVPVFSAEQYIRTSRIKNLEIQTVSGYVSSHIEFLSSIDEDREITVTGEVLTWTL